MKWPSRVRMYHLTRDTNFLWKVVIVILSVCTLLGGIASHLGKRDDEAVVREAMGKLGTQSTPSVIEEIIRKAPFAVTIRLVSSVPHLQSEDGFLETPPDIVKAIGESVLSDQEKQLALAVWHSSVARSPTPELEQIAAERPPRRFANEMLGELLHDKDGTRAAAAYEVEGREFPDASDARTYAIALYQKAGKKEDVQRLMRDPAFGDAVDTRTAMTIAWEEGQWIRLPSILLEREWRQRSALTITMVAFAGLVWISIALHLAQASLFSVRTMICGLAVVLGYFSTFAVLIAGFFKRDLDGFRKSGDVIGDLVFYTIGVGVPEELFKLLFFLPLVPWLVKRGHPLEMLMAAGCTGLGFAISENLNYVEAGGLSTTITRFLTANFLHMALTGIVAGSFCQMIYYRRGFQHFLTQFILAILLHGAYNTAASMQDGSIFWMLLFIGAAYLFFHQLRNDRHPTREPISPVASFAVGSSLVIGMAIILACYQLGFTDGWTSVGMGALSVAVLNVMFVRELGTL